MLLALDRGCRVHPPHSGLMGKEPGSFINRLRSSDSQCPWSFVGLLLLLSLFVLFMVLGMELKSCTC